MTESQLKRILSFPIRVSVVPLMVMMIPVIWLFTEYTFKECWETTINAIKEIVG